MEHLYDLDYMGRQANSELTILKGCNTFHLKTEVSTSSELSTTNMDLQVMIDVTRCIIRGLTVHMGQLDKCRF